MSTKDRIIGRVKRVNGPVIEVMGITDAEMFELVQVGAEKLVGELITLETAACGHGRIPPPAPFRI